MRPHRAGKTLALSSGGASDSWLLHLAQQDQLLQAPAELGFVQSVTGKLGSSRPKNQLWGLTELQTSTHCNAWTLSGTRGPLNDN